MKRGRKPKQQSVAAQSERLAAPGSATRQDHWERLEPLLALKPQHADALALYCRLLEEHDMLLKELGPKPADWFSVTENGYESERPQLRAINVVRGRILELAKALGMLPGKQLAKAAAPEMPADSVRIFAMQRAT